jgi:hypothetical protein
MTRYQTVIRHVTDGTTYSWDLTQLVGFGLVIAPPLREKLLLSRTTPVDAAEITSLYVCRLLATEQTA